MEPYYDHAGITIYHGEACAVLTEMPEASVDVVISDPPYSSGGMFRGDRAVEPTEKYRGFSHNTALTTTREPTATYGTFAGDTRDQRSWLRWVAAWSWATLRVTRPGGHAFLFSDWRQLPAATDALQFGGWLWRGILCWDKGVGRPMRGRFRNHLEYIAWATHGPDDRRDCYPSALISVPTVHTNERDHVTQKPVELLSAILSVVTGDVVLDPFMGSGTTLRAAKDLGRKAIGIEIEERYCEIAAERLSQEVLAL